MQDTRLTPYDQQAPTPRPSVGDVVARKLPLVSWGIVLVLCLGMFFEVFGSLRRTSGSTDPQIYALDFAWSAIALRAAVALVRRELTWWSLAYIALFFVLPLVAEVTTKWWRSTL